jgi:excinuclease UvrABC nuclease subunit
MHNLPQEILETCVLPDDDVIQNLPGTAGFVLFTDSQNRPITLLTAANIKRTAKVKLAEKIDKNKRADLKSITSKIYYTPCRCKFRLAIKYYDAVRKVFGAEYKEHIKLVLPWFITIDFNEKIPSFSITKKPTFKNADEIIGPIGGQRAATAFLKAIEDAFRLCKRSDIVNNPALAKSCPYLQMDACAGVCGGKISSEDYKSLLKEAFEAAKRPAEAIEKFQIQMQTASKELDFEMAAALKKKIEKLSALKKQTYKWTGDLKKLKIVHIDKAGKIRAKGIRAKVQMYAVFIIDFFNIIDLGDFSSDEPDLIYEAINKNLNNPPQDISDEIVERFSIVSYFLYRSKASGIWINTSKGFDREVLLKAISEKSKS